MRTTRRLGGVLPLAIIVIPSLVYAVFEGMWHPGLKKTASFDDFSHKNTLV
jgi:hypothetical protein